ncbi:MAG: peptidase T [Treponemataceae bacterium]
MKTIKQILSNNDMANLLLDRFIRYTKIYSTSSPENADKGIMPSTDQQKDFAIQLHDELKKIGVSQVEITEYGYVYARINATKGLENAMTIGFCAHLDTASEVSGKNVQPQIFENYSGQKITLKNNVVLSPDSETNLLNCLDDTIITSDGTTLLGADDKAGIAEIITAVEFIIKNNIAHGGIEILFSPDEETGHGMDKVPLDKIKSTIFYTLDGGQAGEIEYECFNAFKAEITFTGKSKHTGTARPDFINAITMAAHFITLLPQNESPEATDAYLGFYAPMKITGGIEQSQVTLFLRDFDRENMNYRIESVKVLSKAIEQKNKGSVVTVDIQQQYLNMKEKIQKNPAVMQNLVNAVEEVGITPVFKPIRGGTDGARLTELGIPCPNIFTGGHNFHSRTEWASLSQMVCATEVIIKLLQQWCK